MRAVDFMYDGILLSSFGLIIGDFSGGNDLDTVDTDSQRTFESFNMFNGKWQPLSVTTYRDTLRIKISVVKNPCDQEDMTISLLDIRRVKRWLNRPSYHELRIIDDEYEGIFWMGSANVEEVHSNGVCVGFDLTFTTDRPFALADTMTFSGNVNAGDQIEINDVSDEEGFIYPDIQITVGEACDLSITNDTDNRTMLIKNCEQNEVINISKSLFITTDSNTHKISDDFNWKFLRINNSYSNRLNTLTFSNACSYVISYNPIVKAVIA